MNMFSRLFSKSKLTKTKPRVFTIDYRRGYNNAWTHNIKNYWP
jgi:hypothetical protein